MSAPVVPAGAELRRVAAGDLAIGDQVFVPSMGTVMLTAPDGRVCFPYGTHHTGAVLTIEAVGATVRARSADGQTIEQAAPQGARILLVVMP